MATKLTKKYRSKLNKLRTLHLITREELLEYRKVTDPESKKGFINYANKEIANWCNKNHLSKNSIFYKLKQLRKYILYNNFISRKIRKAIYFNNHNKKTRTYYLFASDNQNEVLYDYNKYKEYGFNKPYNIKECHSKSLAVYDNKDLSKIKADYDYLIDKLLFRIIIEVPSGKIIKSSF